MSTRSSPHSNLTISHFITGIHRSVWLYFVPSVRIVDITVSTGTLDDLTTGRVHYNISSNAPNGDAEGHYFWRVDLLDRTGRPVAEQIAHPSGTILVANAHLWWPFTMHPVAGYQYTLSIRLYDRSTEQLVDSYYQKVGIRSISLTKNAFLINGRDFYFRGFGKHEDMNASIFATAMERCHFIHGASF